MSEHIHKRHNKTLLLYHIVCPIKYQRKVLTDASEQTLKSTCLEIGTDEDQVHFLVQSVPNMLLTRIVQTIKSITAREIFLHHPETKKVLWGGKFWTSDFYANTVGQYGNEATIRNYVKNQGRTYKPMHRSNPTLFDNL
jgi:REP element-mobilizing transposase RayT